MVKMGLDGKVAIVTGGASGIGAATAMGLAGEGARVLVSDLNLEGAEAVAKRIEDAGGEALGFKVDVADEERVREMVGAAVDEFGRLDILHNNAAALGLVERDADVANADAALWDETMAVNLRGPMLGCKYAVPRMIEGGGGSIINTSSGAGVAGDLNRTAYGVSKAGLNSLTQYVATQYGKQGVRCNAIAPALVLTPAARWTLPQEMIEILEAHHLTPALVEPEDIAAAVVFLASDAARFVTGQVLPVDGGFLAHLPTVADMLRASVDSQVGESAGV